MASSLKQNRVIMDHEFDPVSIHELFKATNNHNCIQAKIQLPSKLNFLLLEEMCQDYWDYQLPHLLKCSRPFQNGQIIYFAILKPSLVLKQPSQFKTRFQNGQINNLAILKLASFLNFSITGVFISIKCNLF